MAQSSLWGLYFTLFDFPEDPRAREVYHILYGGPPEDETAQARCQAHLIASVDYTTFGPHERRLVNAYRSLFQHRYEKHPPWEPIRIPEELKDPYVLANQYHRYMYGRSLWRPIGPEYRIDTNPYYVNVLANHDDPPENAIDDLSRAIRYAKEHHECFYGVDQVEMIVKIFDRRKTGHEERTEKKEKQARAALHRLYDLVDFSKELDKDMHRSKREDFEEGRRAR